MEEILTAEGYRVTCATNGQEALTMFAEMKPDLIISDIMMPYLDGFGLLEAVRSRADGMAVPFLFLSARNEPAATMHARRLGADDYLAKPFDPDELLLAVRAKLHRRRAVQMVDTRNAHLQTVVMLANSIEAREKYTRGHVERVRHYALELARVLDWSAEALEMCEFGALLHDLGKVAVPRRILNKRRGLNFSEWAILRRHPITGAKMLEGVDHLRGAVPYLMCHHEHWNGGGYPAGLAGTDIPIEGRLLAIVDTYDAMTTNRPYRRALTPAAALEEIRGKAGTQFDPDLAELFVRLRQAAPPPP